MIGASFLEQDSTTGVPSDVVTPEMIEASKAAAWGGAAPAPAEAAPVSNADAVAAANATIKELSEQVRMFQCNNCREYANPTVVSLGLPDTICF